MQATDFSELNVEQDEGQLHSQAHAQSSKHGLRLTQDPSAGASHLYNLPSYAKRKPPNREKCDCARRDGCRKNAKANYQGKNLSTCRVEGSRREKRARQNQNDQRGEIGDSIHEASQKHRGLAPRNAHGQGDAQNITPN